DNVVVCPAEPRAQLLQAACLAGVLKAPLVLLHRHNDNAGVEALEKRLSAWKAKAVYAVGSAARHVPETANRQIVALRDEETVARVYRRQLGQEGRVHIVVLANPFDAASNLSHVSVLAPWLVLQKRAMLVLTDRTGTDTRTVVQKAAEALKFTPDT